MILSVVYLLGLLAAVHGICYSPVIHGFVPDVILPSVLGSEIHCPAPHVFDHFLCMCVERQHLSLSLSLSPSKRTTLTLRPQLAGLPDMHVAPSRPWKPMFKTAPRVAGASVVVPPLDPYATFNLPARSDVLLAAAKARLVEAAKRRELVDKVMDKVMWRHETAVQLAVAAANAPRGAAPSPLSPLSPLSSPAGGSVLDDFMQDTLRRILYGY